MRRSARRLLAAFLLVLGCAALLIAGPAGPAQAAPSDCGYPAAACECPTLSVSTTAPAPGEAFTVAGVGLMAREKVSLVLRPAPRAQTPTSARKYVLTSLRTDVAGAFTTTVTMPKTAVGEFDVVAVRGSAARARVAADVSCPVDPTSRLAVVLGESNQPDSNQPDRNEPATAFTGFNLMWLLLLAGALVSAGVYANRRGRGSRTEVRSIHG